MAVNQCSGNGRGFFKPRVAGGQAGNGLMGNARWTGVPLKTVLDRAGVQAGAVQVRFDGMDGPVMPSTPDFAKALDLDHARDGEVMLAWSMNGEDLPVLNGYPLRLIVPGYYGTYWVKHCNEITVLDKPLENIWMATVYRVPDNSCACVPPGTAQDKTRPIGRYDVRSFITSLQDGAHVKAGQQIALHGIAFDGGSGIRSVQVSTDNGKTWKDAKLGQDLGKYPSGAGKRPSHSRAAAMCSKCARSRILAKNSRPSRVGIRPATCATRSRVFPCRRVEEDYSDAIPASLSLCGQSPSRQPGSSSAGQVPAPSRRRRPWRRDRITISRRALARRATPSTTLQHSRAISPIRALSGPSRSQKCSTSMARR